MCQASVTHFSECAVNVRRTVFKAVLPSHFVCTVSVPPANVVKVTTTPIYQYINPASKHAIVGKPVFCISHVITTPAPAVAILNSCLPLHVCDVSVPSNLLCHVRKVSPTIPLPTDLATTFRSHALIKRFLRFHQQLMIATRKSVFL